MAATPTLIKARVKYGASNPKDYGNGPRCNVVVTPVNGGDDIKIWGGPEDAIVSLRKGQEIDILQEQRGDRVVSRLLQGADQLQSQSQPQTQNGNGEQQSEDDEAKFDRLLRRSASRYAKAIKAAKFIVKNEFDLELGTDLENPYNPSPGETLELLKGIAATLFIEANRGM